MRFRPLWIAMILFIISSACRPDKLPVLGKPKIVDGREIPHSIPDFTFINQDSALVSNATFADKIYVTDFFFTSCPTICPKVKAQMLRIYERFREEDRLALLSHSIDVKRDTVLKLREYAQNLGVAAPKWHFVTGEKDDIYQIADDYFNIVVDDPSAPGGFDHSGRLVLVDEQRRLRSYCNGTDPKEVDQFIKDVEQLLKLK